MFHMDLGMRGRAGGRGKLGVYLRPEAQEQEPRTSTENESAARLAPKSESKKAVAGMDFSGFALGGLAIATVLILFLRK